jgi:hypothetical protein
VRQNISRNWGEGGRKIKRWKVKENKEFRANRRGKNSKESCKEEKQEF